MQKTRCGYLFSDRVGVQTQVYLKMFSLLEIGAHDQHSLTQLDGLYGYGLHGYGPHDRTPSLSEVCPRAPSAPQHTPPHAPQHHLSAAPFHMGIVIIMTIMLTMIMIIDHHSQEHYD